MDIEFLKITNPIKDKDEWLPVTAKIDKKYTGAVGSQMIKQMKAFENNSDGYKFNQQFNDFSLTGCWLINVDYDYNDYLELTIRYDNADLMNN